jgi:hypothetical protein
MALTRSYNETVRQDLRADPEFRRALLGEVLGCMAAGDIETGKSVLRKYIEGTVGFEAVTQALAVSSADSSAMLAQKTNPPINDLYRVTAYLQMLDSTALTVLGATV